MHKIITGVLVVITLLLGYAVYSQSVSFGAASGASHYQKESFLQGLAAGVRDAFSINNTGKTVTVGTTNTATSTLIAGCVQTYATSTASPIRLTMTTGYLTGTTTFRGVNGGFQVVGQFGTCPNL